jgi:acetolactate synthase-1/2/3 large subunit
MTIREHEAQAATGALSDQADGAELFVAQLVEGGVEVIYINSGTDTFPVQEAIARRQALGMPVPRIVLCLDEAVAGAAAHGHYAVTGQPQAVLVHVDVGTQQLGGALHNAQRGGGAMLICAGRSPYTIDQGVPGGRSSPIHWQQEQLDQHGIVRNYTKWDYQAHRASMMTLAVQRGLQIAASEPAGPTYLSLPREVLLERPDEPALTPPARFAPIPASAARAISSGRGAEALAAAERPLLLTAMAGRDPDAVAPLVELAEMLGAPVYANGFRLCIPTTHPLFADTLAKEAVAEADVILTIDTLVPYIPQEVHPRPDATVIEIDVDPLKPTVPLTGFPIDISIQADPTLAMRALLEALRETSSPEQGARVAARRQAVEQANAERRRGWREAAESKAQQAPLAADYVAMVLNEVIDEGWTVLDEAVGNSPWISRMVSRTRPGSLFKSAGSSLGWALGAAVGVKIADPERRVITVVGDGTFVYGCPTAALWAADVEDAPFLTLIFNNRMHNATRNALRGAFPESYAQANDNWPGIRIDPPPDYAALARACRAHGETVDDPAELRGALERAIAAVDAGQAAVVDVRVAAP